MVSFDDVRVPLSNVLLGPGRAFEIAQGRLGPGRVHHCMRLVGLAEMALELAVRRATERTAFGRPLAKLGGNAERIADARIAIDQARLLVLHAAWKLDTAGLARRRSREVSQIKVAVPNMAQQVIDMAMQLHGGGGLRRGAPAGRGLGQRPLAADGRRPRRGAPRRDRQARARRSTVSRVLVTGGACGLGAALVARFAARGDQVLAADLSGPEPAGGRPPGR